MNDKSWRDHAWFGSGVIVWIVTLVYMGPTFIEASLVASILFWGAVAVGLLGNYFFWDS